MIYPKWLKQISLLKIADTSFDTSCILRCNVIHWQTTSLNTYFAVAAKARPNIDRDLQVGQQRKGILSRRLKPSYKRKPTILRMPKIFTPSYICTIVMPPTSKKLTGHIGFGLCVRPSVHACVRPPVRSRTVHARILKFHIWVPHGKIFDTWVIALSGVMPLWKKSEWNLMHAISYEPCMLGFWNFIHGFHVEK